MFVVNERLPHQMYKYNLLLPMMTMTNILDVLLFLLQSSSEEENEKAFLILNEMILTLKDVNISVYIIAASVCWCLE